MRIHKGYRKMRVIMAWMLLLIMLLGSAVAEMPEDEPFSMWNTDASALNALTEYVEAVTNPDSPDYIPEVDRIATFDMDGTLMGELFPTYLEVMLLTERVLKDRSWQPDEEMQAFGRMTRDCALDKSFPDDYDYQFSYHQAKAFAGMTLTEYADFITRFLVHEADGFEGMTYASAYYLPMVEVVDYLQDHGFKCYVVSGSDRFIVRTFIEGAFDIPAERIIGSDTALAARDQGDADGIEYVFTGDDTLVRTDQLIIKDLKTNKVLQIAQEIGRQPVLSFGNSSGDVSMNNYALLNNRYRSAAFMLVADDDLRDYGNPAKHDELTEKWQGMGYHVISMRDDWKTIYGEEVRKIGEFHWLENYADGQTDTVQEDGTEEKTDEGYQGISVPSPDWVGKLDAAASRDQMLVVAAFDDTATDAWVSLHEKQSDGTWRMVMTTPGFIGKNGLGKTKEGDAKTPVGIFHFNRAFGIADDPGCAIDYVKVNEDSYWSGDQREGFHYNELVSLSDLPGLAVDDSEHIMDYPYHYQLCLNISYNEEGTPGLGSGIFLHCLGPAKPFTGGCVAIPESHMRYVMQHVDEDTTVVIDTYENLTGGADWPDSTWPQER